MNVKDSGGIRIVSALGDHLDASNKDVFRDFALPLAEESDRFLLDMEDVRFVDSSGLGVILACLRAVTARSGTFRICSVSKPVRVLFELVRLERMVEVFDDRQSALAAFSGGTAAAGGDAAGPAGAAGSEGIAGA